MECVGGGVEWVGGGVALTVGVCVTDGTDWLLREGALTLLELVTTGLAAWETRAGALTAA